MISSWRAGGLGACVVSRGKGRTGSRGAELVSPVLREVCSCGQFIRRWPLEVGFVGTESLRVQGSGGATLGLWLQGRSFRRRSRSGRGHPASRPTTLGANFS